MTNPTTPVKGYRSLSDKEIALMNEGKALAELCGAFVAKLRSHPATSQGLGPEHSLVDGRPSIDQRWVSIGATDLQTGFMALTRGIAQPTTF